MSIETPKFQRDRVLREEAARRRMRHLLQQVIGALAQDERLGDPFREGDRIVIPIVRAEEAGTYLDDDPVSMRALMAAWLNEPTQ